MNPEAKRSPFPQTRETVSQPQLPAQERGSLRFDWLHAVGGVFASSGGVAIGGMAGLLSSVGFTELSPEVIQAFLTHHDLKTPTIGVISTVSMTIGSFYAHRTYLREMRHGQKAA